MCGIAGIYNFESAKPVSQDLLLKMSDSIVHRGPDDSGIYLDQNVGIAHRRLSILDLSELGHQPMHYQNRYSIVYNGEVYNYVELRKQLENKGYLFRSRTDTEVLLAMYVEFGENMLGKLNGMFSFAIWDRKERILFAARDRMGIKPFVYYQNHHTFYFASEVKAILEIRNDWRLSEDVFDELLLFRYVAGENTIYSDIKKLLPGHSITCRDGNVTIKKWHSIYEALSNQVSINYDRKDMVEILDSSVAFRTISDVPVGVLLSGGLDSSCIAASLHAQGFKGISSFNIGFEEKEYDESHIAEEVSKKFDMDFHKLVLNSENAYDNLIESTRFADEPLMHQNDPHLLAICKYSKPFVTVLLSGEGGDELFSGYFRYKALRQPSILGLARFGLNLFPKMVKGMYRLNKLRRYLNQGSIDNLIMYNACNDFQSDYRELGFSLNSSTFEYRSQVVKESKELFSHPLRRTMYLDQHTYLQSLLDRNDKMSMGASIECRVPFLDHRMVEYSNTLPLSKLAKGKKGKSNVIESFRNRLPKSVIDFKKVGLATPYSNYFRNSERFKALIHQMSTNQFFENELFRNVPIRKLIDQYYKDNSNEQIIRELLMISLWYDLNRSRISQ